MTQILTDSPLGEAVFNRFVGTSFAAGNYCASSSVRPSCGEDRNVFPPNFTGTPSLISNL